MTASWYLFRSKPNKEDFLARQLAAYGIKVFLPPYPCKYGQPAGTQSRGFFPQLPFVHVDLDKVSASTLQWMPGAVNLVSFDGQPASVPEALIYALERQVENINTSQKNMLRDLKPGDIVSIRDGPFAGYEAIFDGQISGRERVRVLLSFLQKRQIPVELRESQIARVKHA